MTKFLRLVVAIAGAMSVGAMIALGFWVFNLEHAPSDEVMLSEFRSHRAVFDRLLQMFAADNQDMLIGIRGGSWVGTATSTGVSPARRDEYIRLMRPSGIVSMGVTHVRESRAEPYDRVTFFSHSRGIVSPEKAWVYSEVPPIEPEGIPLTDGNTEAYRFPPNSYRKVCRSIEKLWYICVDYED